MNRTRLKMTPLVFEGIRSIPYLVEWHLVKRWESGNQLPTQSENLLKQVAISTLNRCVSGYLSQSLTICRGVRFNGLWLSARD
jgi:hypothetical protein